MKQGRGLVAPEDTTGILTYYESASVRVECARFKDQFVVRTRRAGQICAENAYRTETQARANFERIVEAL